MYTMLIAPQITALHSVLTLIFRYFETLFKSVLQETRAALIFAKQK